jgi:dihydroorotate dehydrogenase electron transfer subunit
MKQFQSEIVCNKQISADFFEMMLSWDLSAGAPEPGQFFTIRVSKDFVPLLRRPFAFAGFDESAKIASVIYQKRGRGTEILSEMEPGGKIDIVGPLGNTFPVSDNQGKTIAVAGGIGLGPILFLVSHLKKRGIETEFIFGCRSGSLIPNADSFKNADPKICTDDGTAGFKGNVVQYISANMQPDGKTVLYGCGPEMMLESMSKLAQSTGAKAWVSLEAIMACGVGACMGCAVPATNGYPRVCKEGPVFDGKDILWEQM